MPLSASFTSTLDRIDAATASLRALATSQTNHAPKPSFARAILHAEPHHVLREAEPWEHALLARVEPPLGPRVPQLDASGAPAVALGPAPVNLATPLRPGRKKREKAEDAIEPEDYAQAGLKLLERYEAIRPMPRAQEKLSSILEQCTIEREEISQIEARLTQSSGGTEDDVSFTRALKEEEARLKAVQKEIDQLRKRRDELLKKKASRAPKAPPPRPPPPSSAEAAFWDTPDAGPRTRPPTFKNRDDLLTSGSLDTESRLADISSDFSMTGPTSPTPGSAAPAPPSKPEKVAPKPIFDLGRLAATRSKVEDDDLDEEPTIMIKKPPLSFQAPSRAADAALIPEGVRGEEDVPEPDLRDAQVEEATKPELALGPESEPDITSATETESLIHINEDVSRVFSKMWSTVGETILAGRSGNPPDDEETLSHLESLSAGNTSALNPTDAPPSEAQCATARLVLSLLRAPGMALSLERLKTSIGGPQATKVFYACVAKRMVKIERGGGEQTVKFTV